MDIRLATEADQKRWNEFVFSLPHGTFHQSWEWGQMQQLLDVSYWRFVAVEEEVFQAVFLVLKRELPLGKGWLYVPRGPLVREDKRHYVWGDIQRRLVELSKEEKALFIKVDPAYLLTTEEGEVSESFLQEHAWQKSDREVQPKNTILFPLDPSENDLLGVMHKKTRYNIRLAEKKGVSISFHTSLDAVDTFLELAQSVKQRGGFHYHPANYYRAMLSALGAAGMIEIAIARYNNEPLAAHLMVYAGDTATYVHGASSMKYRSVMAPQYTYWETIRRAKERGHRVYDFFGVAPANAGDNHPWSGITRIKEGFGGQRVEYIGGYDYVVDESMFVLFNAARNLRQLWR